MNEYDLYVSNNVLDDIIAHSPEDDTNDLKLNYYNYYYKPYSLWTE